MQNITELESFQKLRSDFEAQVKKEHKLNESERQRFISPSGDYYLVIDTLEHPTNPRKNCTVGNVCRANDELITTVYRNHPKFVFSWIEAHPSGHPYLLCGFDFQGQTVVELDTGKRKDFLPPEAVMGKGRCWANYVPSPHGSRLMLESCYIGGSIMTSIVDFSRPLEGNWTHIGYLDTDDEPLNDETLSECTRKWISEDSLENTYVVDVRKSDGKRVSMLKTADRKSLTPADIDKKEIIARWQFTEVINDA